ncbi:967_t:CDS:2, partial [Acaulospora colombiana]
MSNVYEAIKILDSKEERTALRTLFTNNPEKRAEAERILPTCEDNGEIVAYFKELLKPAQEDEELLTRIKEAWVFLVSFENGFGLRTNESDTYFAIGSRMLFQLLREKMMFPEITNKYEPPDPLDVVKLIAKHHNRNLKNVTVILVVDGMQQLMLNNDDGLKSDSSFYKTLTSVADLAFNGIFVIPVCTSTITGPIDGMLRYSQRKRIYLPVTSLQPPNYRQGDSLVPVFKNDEITSILVEDCGGHGRALEVLNDCLVGLNIEECNVNTLMNDLRSKLTEKYRNSILASAGDARPIARAILTRRILNRYKPVPKTNKTPDEFAGGGLIRFEQIENSPKGYLTAPYIWLWIFVEISQHQGDSILRDWEFADYEEQRALLNPSAVIEEDELITISDVHAGARLNGDIQFKNHNLRPEIAKHHTNTKSKSLTTSEWNVDCCNSTVDPGTESLNEIHQYKLREKAVSKKEYQKEREKSASENDFFIFFTTTNCNIEIQK